MDELAARRPAPSKTTQRVPRQLLWREALGARLRRLRNRRRLTLTQLAAQAGVSPQYLSEVERGIKEPSSEMIAAIGGALGLTLIQLTMHVADELQRPTLRPALRSTLSTVEESGGPAQGEVQLAAA